MGYLEAEEASLHVQIKDQEEQITLLTIEKEYLEDKVDKLEQSLSDLESNHKEAQILITELTKQLTPLMPNMMDWCPDGNLQQMLKQTKNLLTKVTDE